jgi:anti-sigma-K factor RskA
MSTTIRDPEDLRDLVAAYAIGAVDDDERAAIDRFLMTDRALRAEADGFAHAVRQLRTPEGPAPAVWTGIQAALESGEHRSASVVPISATRRTERAPRSRRVGRRVTRVVAVAAAVAAAAAVAIAAPFDDETTIPNTPASAVEAAAREALRADGAERLSLVTEGGSESVDVVVLPDGRGYVLDTSLAPSAEDPYRLVALTNEGPVVVALLGNEIVTTAFELPAGALGLVVARGEDTVASAALPAGLLAPPVTTPTLAPTASTPPPSVAPSPSSSSPRPPLLPTLPSGALAEGLLDLLGLPRVLP